MNKLKMGVGSLRSLTGVPTSARNGIAILAFAVFLLAGCTVKPVHFTASELDAFAADKKKRAVAAEQTPVTGKIDLYEAMARALKFNLDHKLEMAEIALRHAEFREGGLDMLPELVVRLDWSDRSNQPFSRSLDETGIVSAGATTSTDIGSAQSGLELSWDILDFGLSYYRAKQAGDRYLIAEEQRRSTVNKIIEDVRTSYWRAVASQRLLGRITALERRARRALSEARLQVSQGEGNRLEALKYQREMLEILKAAEALRGELTVAQNQLAALMNLPQGHAFEVAVPKQGDLRSPVTALSSAKMTEMALRNRPEMREIAYRIRINETEEDVATLELLPSIRGYLGLNYDTNDFLVNENWTGWGARVSWDLINLARYPARNRTVVQQSALLDARALALTQAISTQVYVSNKRFHNLQRETRIAREHYYVSQEIYAQARREFEAGTGSQREYVRENLEAVLAALRFNATYAEMQGGFANVYASVGLNAYDGQLTGAESVDALAQSLRSLWRERGDRG